MRILNSYQPRDLQNYYEIECFGNLKLFQRSKSINTYLIVISEYLEDWILKRAFVNRIDPKSFNLERDANLLHNIPHIERKKDFRLFLNELTDRDDETKKIKSWILEYTK